MKLKKNIALSESGFIFNPATGDSYSVNQLASEVLGLLKDAKSLEEVKGEILKKYEVTAASLEEDLDDFTAHLQQLGLLDHE
jgi:hypothetical protein